MSTPGQTFDPATVAETIAQVRPVYPVVANLIEDLWAEVQRLSAPTYVAPMPMTKHDTHGPFRGKPEVDLEFYDVTGNSCGSSTVGLELRINDRGILIISETRVAFTAPYPLQLAGYRVWFGSDMVECSVPPVPLNGGDQYLLSLNIPIRLGRDIDHDPGGDGGPPRPMPRPPDKTSSKVDQES